MALAQQAIERPRPLALAAFGPPWFSAWRPRIDIEMEPCLGVLDKALQEQGAGDRAGEAIARRVVDVGNLRIEPRIVGWPQRQPPQRIALGSGTARDVGGKLLVIGV